METVECAWKDLFDESERISLDEGFFLTGFMAIVFGLWLNVAIIMTDLSANRSYRNLANFTAVACIRRVVPLIAHFPLFCSVEGPRFDPKCCEFFAFLETFLAVYEVEWLTHVCIERYIIAKYTSFGWPIQNYHYNLFQCLCLFFASLYSFPPLLGIGRYGFDFSCNFYTFDVILPETWKRYIVVVIFILRSIKPTMFMLMMLIWARVLERKLADSEEILEQKKFTKNVIVMTLISLVCWSPIAIIRGSVILSQLLSSTVVVPFSTFYIKWAMLIHWMSPAFTVLILFASDKKIRYKMLHLNVTKAEVRSEDKQD